MQHWKFHVSKYYFLSGIAKSVHTYNNKGAMPIPWGAIDQKSIIEMASQRKVNNATKYASSTKEDVD